MAGEPIRFEPLNDGSEEDCQCARCGSSAGWIVCENCGGQGEYDTYDDEFDDVETCHTCRGKGGWNQCLSSAEHCKANPIPGREDVPRGKIEWFTRPERSPSPDSEGDNGK